MKGCIIEANLEQPGQVVNNIAYQFFGSNLQIDIFLKTKEHQKKGALKQKIEVSLYTMIGVSFHFHFALLFQLKYYKMVQSFYKNCLLVSKIAWEIWSTLGKQ